MIRRLFLGLVIATLARAQAQEFASPASHVSQSQSSGRPARANVRGEAVPAPVRRMADWVVASADNGSLSFAIIDKKDAEVVVFDAQGQLLGAAPALLGLGVGDDFSAPGVGDKPLSAIRPQDRTTPAGRFNAFLGHERGHPDFFWVDYKNAVALHRVVKGMPKDRRAERLGIAHAAR